MFYVFGPQILVYLSAISGGPKQIGDMIMDPQNMMLDNHKSMVGGCGRCLFVFPMNQNLQEQFDDRSDAMVAMSEHRRFVQVWVSKPVRPRNQQKELLVDQDLLEIWLKFDVVS